MGLFDKKKSVKDEGKFAALNYVTEDGKRPHEKPRKGKQSLIGDRTARLLANYGSDGHDPYVPVERAADTLGELFGE